MQKQPDVMEKIVSLCKRRGFIFQSSEIYGGLASTWDYGPLGAELKRNLKEAWWRSNVYERDDIDGLDCAILMRPETWMAELLEARDRTQAGPTAPPQGLYLAAVEYPAEFDLPSQPQAWGRLGSHSGGGPP